MLEGLLVGLKTAMSFQNFAMVSAGCLIGTFIGILPGLGLMSIIAIMSPIAISMGDRSAALIFLAGVYYVAIFGGSTSSILLNAPGGIMNLHSGLGFMTLAIAIFALPEALFLVLQPKVAGTADNDCP